MHLVKEVLRLTAAGLSQRQIARSLHLSHGVVGKYQAAAQRAGLSWPLPEALDDVTLANRLCTKESTRAPTAHVAPDFANKSEGQGCGGCGWVMPPSGGSGSQGIQGTAPTNTNLSVDPNPK